MKKTKLNQTDLITVIVNEIGFQHSGVSITKGMSCAIVQAVNDIVAAAEAELVVATDEE